MGNSVPKKSSINRCGETSQIIYKAGIESIISYCLTSGNAYEQQAHTQIKYSEPRLFVPWIRLRLFLQEF
jgi:hypothetical protein